MLRLKVVATQDGGGAVPLSQAEEAARDAEELAFAQDAPNVAKAAANAPILAQMAAVNVLILDAMGDGDDVKVAEHRATKAALKTKLV